MFKIIRVGDKIAIIHAWKRDVMILI